MVRCVLREFYISQYPICDTGRGLALVPPSSPDSRPWVIVVPFCLPGERVRAKIYKHEFGKQHSFADFIEILRPNDHLRDDKRVKCQYFTKCGGCQYQVRRTR